MKTILSSALMLLCGLVNANANLTMYTGPTGQTAFDALGLPLATLSWASVPPTYYGYTYQPNANITFTAAPNGYGLSADPYTSGNGTVLSGDYGSYITASFTPGVYAVSEEISTGAYPGTTATINLSNGGPYTVPLPFYEDYNSSDPRFLFIGFTSSGASGPITSITFTDDTPSGNGGPAPVLFQVQYTPEPGFYGLLALGMGLLLFVGWRRRRA
jgi:hypothetical protein